MSSRGDEDFVLDYCRKVFGENADEFIDGIKERRKQREKEKENPNYSRKRKTGGRAPRVQLNHFSVGRLEEEDSLGCAEAALSKFNFNSVTKQGPEYELVKALGAMHFTLRRVYHCNFIARPKDGTEADDHKLFFAQLTGEVVEHKGSSRDIVYTCTFSCILGPLGVETGLHCCTCCARIPGYIQHPESGFTKRAHRFPNKHMRMPVSTRVLRPRPQPVGHLP